MSFLSDLLNKRITPTQFVDESIGYIGTAIASPGGVASYIASDALAGAKSSASAAVTVVDTDMGPVLAAGATELETFLEAQLAKWTGGLSVVANPLINAGIDTGANMLKNVIDAWALKTKAGLTPTKPAPS